MRRAYTILALLLASTLLVLSACAARQAARPTGVRSTEAELSLEKQVEAPAPMPTAMPSSASASMPRRIIYEARLELVVTDTDATSKRITAIAEELGGYVADASLYRVNDEMEGRLTVRVPQERFDEALARFRDLAVRVDRESIKTNDVTDQYVDLQARLKNLEATEVELRELLTDVRKRTQRASDVMEVYRELANVRQEIEQVKGRIQMLDKLTALSTITITLHPYELSQPVTTKWDPRVTLRRAWIALISVMQRLVDVIIYLVVVVVPVLLLILTPLAVVILLVRQVVRRRRRGSQ